ncbi:2-dehydropantoate 2-reductase, partial [Thioclava sp. BHET1]
MRCLILGAGGVGGYFGGRLLEAGRDVTFLVRPARAERMARDGLRILSPNGDLHLPAPPTVTRETISAPYDLIILSCRAYDLDSALDAIAPAVGPETAILPLLNGMAHMQALTARFGPGAVLGGCCAVSTVLDAEGRIHQMGAFQSLNFGEMTGTLSPRAQAIGAVLDGCGFAVKASPTIAQDMWEKWMFIASAAGMTCLMRAAIGDIEAAGASDLT